MPLPSIPAGTARFLRPPTEREAHLARQRARAAQDPISRQNIVVGTTAAATAAVVPGVALGATVARTGPGERTLFSLLHAQRDRPINEVPIVMQHNATSNPGNGTLPLVASSQVMDVETTLRSTPVRAFEFDLHPHGDQIAVNHGGLYDSTVQRPISLAKAAGQVNRFLDEPENRDQVIYVMIESHVGNRGTDDAMERLEGIFGDKLFTPAQFRAFEQVHHRFPSTNELTAHGPRVVVVSDVIGAHRAVPFGKNWFVEKCGGQHLWEDRTMLGNLGEHANHEIPHDINVERFDELRKHGGILKLDKMVPNDPRFYLPVDRAHLALRPDVSFLHENVYVAPDYARALAFGGGVALASSMATFGALSAVLRGVSHERMIRHAGDHLTGALGQITSADVLAARADGDIQRPLDDDEVVDVVARKLTSRITAGTFTAGLQSGIPLAGASTALSALFPTLQSPLGWTAPAILGASLVASVGATVVNRKRMQAAIDEVRGDPDLRSAIDVRRRAFERRDAVEELHALKKDVDIVRRAAAIEQTSRVLFWSALMLRFSGSAKYAITNGSKAAWTTSAGAMLLTAAAFDAGAKHQARRTRLRQLERTIAEMLAPFIDARGVPFFGTTPYEAFVRDNLALVRTLLGPNAPATSTAVLKALALPENDATLKLVRLACTIDTRKQMVLRTATELSPDRSSVPEMQAAIEATAVQRFAQMGRNEVLVHGTMTTLKAVGVIASLAVLFPAFTAFVLAGAVSALPVGLIATVAVAFIERGILRRGMQGGLERVANDDDPAKLAHQRLSSQYTGALAEGMVRESLLKRAADQMAATSSSSSDASPGDITPRLALLAPGEPFAEESSAVSLLSADVEPGLPGDFVITIEPPREET